MLNRSRTPSLIYSIAMFLLCLINIGIGCMARLSKQDMVCFSRHECLPWFANFVLNKNTLSTSDSILYQSSNIGYYSQLSHTISWIFLSVFCLSMLHCIKHKQKNITSLLLLIGLISSIQYSISMLHSSLINFPTWIIAYYLCSIISFGLCFWLFLLHLPHRIKPHFRFRPLRAFLIFALCITSLQMISGVLINVHQLGLVCTHFPKCNQSWFGNASWSSLWYALNPSHFHYQQHRPYFELNIDQAVSLLILHRALALLCTIYLLFLALTLILSKRFSILSSYGYTLLALVMLTGLVGILDVYWLLPPTMSIAHMGLSLCLLLLLLRVIHRVFYIDREAICTT